MQNNFEASSKVKELDIIVSAISRASNSLCLDSLLPFFPPTLLEI